MGKAFRDLLQRATGDGDGEPTSSSSLPPKVVVIPPSGFADTWKSRPSQPVKIGLRLISEDLVAKAQANAVDFAIEYHPNGDSALQRDLRIETYNAALMREILVHVCCDPTDVDQQYFKVTPNDTIRIAFRDVTVRRLWEEYERLSRSTSPLTQEASDEEIGALGAMLLDVDMLIGVDDARAARMRRLLMFVRSELAELGIDTTIAASTNNDAKC